MSSFSKIQGDGECDIVVKSLLNSDSALVADSQALKEGLDIWSPVSVQLIAELLRGLLCCC